LQPAATKKCVDCGNPAECYDHRDYTRPLKVEPVCKACNNRRGPGWPLPELGDGLIHKHGVKSIGKCWASLEGGDGFSPLECRIPPEIEATADEAIRAYALQEWMDVLDVKAAVARLKSSNGGHRTGWTTPIGIARAEFFKRHDPWYA
jgi:hypothetical protein